MTKRRAKTVADKADELLRDNPEWSYIKAIQEAEKVINSR